MFVKSALEDVNSVLSSIIREHASSDINAIFRQLFELEIKDICSEWNIDRTWISSEAIKNAQKHVCEDHVHSEINPFGFRLTTVNGQEFITAPHIHRPASEEVIGCYSITNIINNIHGIFDNSMDIICDEHSARMLQILRKETNTMDSIKNSSFFGDKLNLHQEKDITAAPKAQQTETGKEPLTAGIQIAEKISDGYNADRLQKYKMPVNAASIGDIASAMGESLDEVMNRRDVRLEDKIKNEFLGVNNEKLSTVKKTYPTFYIPLAIMGLEKMLEQDYEVEKTVNFHWCGTRLDPIAYQNFEVDYGVEKRLNTDATKFCTYKPTNKKVIIRSGLEATMTGAILCIEFIAARDNVGLADGFFEKLDKWMKENNYYKGKKISASGSFLNVGKYEWDDFICDSEIKDNIFDDVIGFLNHADLYKKNELPFKRGLILYGRPGCGKTLLGKVVANKVPASFIWVTAAQAGSSEFIKQIFELAREIAPSVLFFEDIDMYTVDRHFGVFNPKVGEMLAQMDGMDENNGLIVIATTNRLDIIESALAERPSRFDRRYCLDKMSEETREAMVSAKLGNAILKDITPKEIAQLIAGLNGCFIQEVIISAKRKAISRGDVNAEGIVTLTAPVIHESVKEVMQAFDIAIDKMDHGILPTWSEDAAEAMPVGFVGPNNEVVIKLNKDKSDKRAAIKAGNDKLTLAVTQHPKNVNLTQPEKDDLDAEIKSAMGATIKASDRDKKEYVEEFVSDEKLADFIIDLTGKRLEDVDWQTLKKSDLRKIFRHMVICRNVRSTTGNGDDPLKDKKTLRKMLHAMDMLSDRYYWVHALARIDTEFGRKANIPFNPYKDQTSPDGALNVYRYVTGQVPTKKQQEDKINKENGITVPEPFKTNDKPDYQFNDPQYRENKLQPKNMK